MRQEMISRIQRMSNLPFSPVLMFVEYATQRIAEAIASLSLFSYKFLALLICVEVPNFT